MFSSISPDYEVNLKEELYGCFKYMGIPFDVLDRMPTRDRKYYIARHNMLTEEENNKTMGKKGLDNSEAINDYAFLEQQNIANAKKRE